MKCEEMKPELKDFIIENMTEYTENLQTIRIAQLKVEKALKLTNFPLFSSDKALEILDVLDFIIEDIYRGATNSYNKTKKIEEEYLRINGSPMDVFADRVFERFIKSHSELCESYVDLEKRIEEKSQKKFKRSLIIKRKPVEYEIKNENLKNENTEQELCKC